MGNTVVTHSSLLWCSIVVAAVFGLAGCERTDTGNTGYLLGSATTRGIDDAAITATVKARLAADTELLPMQISVETQQGIVTLSGLVPLAQIGRAEQIARNVNGVRDVDNQLKPATFS